MREGGREKADARIARTRDERAERQTIGGRREFLRSLQEGQMRNASSSARRFKSIIMLREEGNRPS